MAVAKWMKNMEMSQTWTDTFVEGYIHQLQPKPTHKILKQLQKHPDLRFIFNEHHWYDHETFSFQFKEKSAETKTTLQNNP